MTVRDESARAAVAAWRQVPAEEEQRLADISQQRWRLLLVRQRRVMLVLLGSVVLVAVLTVLMAVLTGHHARHHRVERPAWLDITAATTSTIGLVSLVLCAVRLFRSTDVLGRRSNLLSPSERVLARRQVKGKARYGSAQLPLLRLVAQAMQGRVVPQRRAHAGRRRRAQHHLRPGSAECAAAPCPGHHSRHAAAGRRPGASLPRPPAASGPRMLSCHPRATSAAW